MDSRPFQQSSPDPGVIPVTDLTEHELLNRAISYRTDALSELYDRYESKIYGYIYRRTGNKALAEDLTAQVFLKMLEAIRERKAWHSSFSGWLYRIAHNLVIDYYRRRDRKPQIPIDEAPVLPTTKHDPVTTAETKLDAERLRAAIRRLTEDQAEVVSLRFLEGYSINEVASMMTKSEGAVKALQYRAVATLRQLLEHEQLG